MGTSILVPWQQSSLGVTLLPGLSRKGARLFFTADKQHGHAGHYEGRMGTHGLLEGREGKGQIPTLKLPLGPHKGCSLYTSDQPFGLKESPKSSNSGPKPVSECLHYSSDHVDN